MCLGTLACSPSPPPTPPRVGRTHQHRVVSGEHSTPIVSPQCPECVQALTVEEAKERRERMAKMRSLLFAHEQKAKRLKAIKSKGFHRHAKKAAKMKVHTYFNQLHTSEV